MPEARRIAQRRRGSLGERRRCVRDPLGSPPSRSAGADPSDGLLGGSSFVSSGRRARRPSRPSVGRSMEIAPCDTPRAGRRVRTARARVNRARLLGSNSDEARDPLAIGRRRPRSARRSRGSAPRRWVVSASRQVTSTARSIRPSSPGNANATATVSPTASRTRACRQTPPGERLVAYSSAGLAVATADLHGDRHQRDRDAARRAAGSQRLRRRRRGAPARARGALGRELSARARGSIPRRSQDAMQNAPAPAPGRARAAQRVRRASCAAVPKAARTTRSTAASSSAASGAGSRGIARRSVERTRGAGKKQPGAQLAHPRDLAP